MGNTRLKASGQRVGAVCLRHTTATQLLYAGCPVTSIQKFLGHKKLNTTMVYARAYDQTVEPTTSRPCSDWIWLAYPGKTLSGYGSGFQSGVLL
jgi:integrase